MAGTDYQIRHLALVPNEVATVTLTNGFRNLEVLSVTGTAPVYFTVNGVDPVIEGDDTFVLPLGINSIELNEGWSVERTTIVVKLISGGTPQVSVRGW